MTWIVIEGVDCSGKSSVSDIYKQKKYEIHHMSAPDKKFSEPGYAGVSYLDECLETYMHFDGKDVVFDRSIYGEMVWPDVYGRKNQLSSEDIEVLRELEQNNNTEYILMSPTDYEAHWQRCVESKQPLNRGQFNMSIALYDKLEKRFSFQKKVLSDYNEDMINNDKKDTDVILDPTPKEEDKSIYQLKLDEANAINLILSAKIVKRKGSIYDVIEKSIRAHLQEKLSNIFNNNNANNSLTNDEIFIFKKYVSKLKQTMEKKR